MAHAVLENLNSKDSPSVVGVVNGIVASISVLEKDLTTATFESVDTSDSLLGYNRYTVIPAGGTIDFVFNGLDGVRACQTSFVPGYIRGQVRSTVEFNCLPPILKDSRNLTKDDIDIVVDLVREAPTGFVLVTMGILKMAELRKRLGDALSRGDDHDNSKRVILHWRTIHAQFTQRERRSHNLGYAHGKLGSLSQVCTSPWRVD